MGIFLQIYLLELCHSLVFPNPWNLLFSAPSSDENSTTPYFSITSIHSVSHFSLKNIEQEVRTVLSQTNSGLDVAEKLKIATYFFDIIVFLWWVCFCWTVRGMKGWHGKHVVSLSLCFCILRGRGRHGKHGTQGNHQWTATMALDSPNCLRGNMNQTVFGMLRNSFTGSPNLCELYLGLPSFIDLW